MLLALFLSLSYLIMRRIVGVICFLISCHFFSIYHRVGGLCVGEGAAHGFIFSVVGFHVEKMEEERWGMGGNEMVGRGKAKGVIGYAWLFCFLTPFFPSWVCFCFFRLLLVKLNFFLYPCLYDQHQKSSLTGFDDIDFFEWVERLFYMRITCYSK